MNTKLVKLVAINILLCSVNVLASDYDITIQEKPYKRESPKERREREEKESMQELLDAAQALSDVRERDARAMKALVDLQYQQQQEKLNKEKKEKEIELLELQIKLLKQNAEAAGQKQADPIGTSSATNRTEGPKQIKRGVYITKEYSNIGPDFFTGSSGGGTTANCKKFLDSQGVTFDAYSTIQYSHMEKRLTVKNLESELDLIDAMVSEYYERKGF